MEHILRQFALAPPFLVEPLGQGNINKTFLVTCSSGQFVLQAMNGYLYPEPEKVIHNFLQIFPVQQKFFREHRVFSYYQSLEFLATPEGEYLVWENKQAYRLLRYLKEGQIFQTLGDLDFDSRQKVAYELGKGWAIFHRSVQEVEPLSLKVLLNDFHDTAKIYEQFLQILEDSATNLTPRNWKSNRRTREWVAFIREHSFLATYAQRFSFPLRVTHNDTKLNNCVFAPKTFEVLSLIDLDTLQAGFLYFDVGDGIRSATNLAGEESRDLSQVDWDLASYAQIARGYLEHISFLTEEEQKILAYAPQIIAFELGIRFFQDYLQGDIYFQNQDKQRPERNLERAEVQLQLVARFHQKEKDLLQVFC